MPSAIVETPSKGDAINAPVGADPRTAASVRTPFQATGNRLKFLENFYDAIKAWVLGGTITPAGDVTLAGTLNADEVAATLLRGGLRLRFSKPTVDTSYNAASGVDLIYIDRTALAAGTTTITISDSGRANGDMVYIVITNSSGGKDVDLVIPGQGTNSHGDSTQKKLLYWRVSPGLWETLLDGDP